MVIFLVDTRSTHNFVNGNVLKRIGGNLQTIDSFTVTVANGEQLKAHEVCKSLPWEVQGVQQTTDFFVLSL